MTDDRYTELVLEAPKYEELRHRRGYLSRLSIATKIGGCSCLFLLAALLAPIVAVLPPAVQDQYVGQDPVHAGLSLSLLVLFGCGCLVFGCLGLTWLVLKRQPVEELSTDAAWRFVGLENIFTGIAFVTGTLSIAFALGLASIGLFGIETVDNLAASGVDPYQGNAMGSPTPLESSLVAVGGAVLAAALSILVRRRLDIERSPVVEVNDADG